MKNNLKFALALVMTMAVGTVQTAPSYDFGSAASAASKLLSVLGSLVINATVVKGQLPGASSEADKALQAAANAQINLITATDPMVKIDITLKAIKAALESLENTSKFVRDYSGITGTLMGAAAEASDKFKDAITLPNNQEMQDAVSLLNSKLTAIFASLKALIQSLETAAAQEAAKPCAKPAAPVKPTTTTAPATKPAAPAKPASTAGMTPAQRRVAAGK